MQAPTGPSRAPQTTGAVTEFDHCFANLRKSFDQGLLAALSGVIERLGTSGEPPPQAHLSQISTRVEEFERLCDEAYLLLEHSYKTVRQRVLLEQMGVPSLVDPTQDIHSYSQAMESLQANLQNISNLRRHALDTVTTSYGEQQSSTDGLSSSSSSI
jgi:hypothetical protein